MLSTSNLSVLNISEEAAGHIAIVLSHNIKLQELYLGENNLQASSTKKITVGFQDVLNLKTIDISNNNISKEAAGFIAIVLSHNTMLQ